MEEIGQRLWLQIEKYDEEMESLYVEQEGLHAKIQELQKALKVSSTLEEETTFVQHATLLESFPERIQVLYSKLREIEAEIDRRIEEN